MNSDIKTTVLITGASTGIGAVYADRFARRGHALVLVARDAARLGAVAERLRRESGVTVDTIVADLTDPDGLAGVEARLRDDPRVGVLVNNAGASLAGGFLNQTPDQVTNLIGLNVTALTRLAATVAPRFAADGSGAIVNIASVVGFAPEVGMTVYGATKAFVLYLSQGLHLELGPRGRVCAGGAAIGHPHRDLGAVRPGCGRPARGHGRRRTSGRGSRGV